MVRLDSLPAPSAETDRLLPTPERARRGVELLEPRVEMVRGKPVITARTDDDGRAISAYHAPDILTLMERRGSISYGQRQAGEDFRRAFRRAHISDLQSSDPSRPFVSGLGIHRTLSERGGSKEHESLWKAIDYLGGLTEQSGNIMWHVIGLDWTLKEWALNYSRQRLRHVSQETASGILIGALCPLAVFYGHEKKR